MPMIDWTADEAEEVRQLLLDRIDYVRKNPSAAPSGAAYLYFIKDLRGILAKLEAAYAND